MITVRVCKSELYPPLLPRNRHTITQVSPWYRIKAWNCAILVAVARILYIYTRSYEGRGECPPKVERRQCDQRRLDVRNASGTRFYESSLAIDKSLYSVSLSLSFLLSLFLSPRAFLPTESCGSGSCHVIWNIAVWRKSSEGSQVTSIRENSKSRRGF